MKITIIVPELMMTSIAFLDHRGEISVKWSSTTSGLGITNVTRVTRTGLDRSDDTVTNLLKRKLRILDEPTKSKPVL